ncbi:tubulin--tyrosine ligase-like protein 12 [Pseudomyrmex gracilis]|uniref:tubulin--tyrosine ligase-like protein 12 n=1 Tax=Pseudomyrmex gracilis TaxID=219809 RepID=UPI000995210D|nr:tubulin--tyrosine ligase-like protein 12 [Pseudomyrmex gracilis]XP_020278450.1 tubulin--tyrosine ligase-like protein 12 [Pseudomyrmex gracilis]
MNGIDKSLFTFLETHKLQLQALGVPELFWEVLCIKLNNEIFDAGRVFTLMRIDYEDRKRHGAEPAWKLIVSADDGISAQDQNNIFLVDFAWSYYIRYARDSLTEVPGLLDRMCSLMDLDTDTDEQEKIENVLREMWRYNQPFRTLVERNNSISKWVVMDEVGSAVNHSDEPNFRIVHFAHMSQTCKTYVLMFPIKDVAEGEEVTRDFAEGLTNDPEKRRALLLPWMDGSFRNESFEQTEPSTDYFLSGHIPESLPERTDVVEIDTSKKLKVYSEYSTILSYLTDPAFEITDIMEEADVLWFVSHYKTYKELNASSPNVFVNQFPYENVLTIKDLLSIVCRRKAKDKLYDYDTLETYPEWLPTTYNLSTELVQFVSYFTHRAEKNLDNIWICKPWNLARSMDTYITDNLYAILRLPCGGPKIAQKYITRPVLYNRPDVSQVKFDVRYVLLLKSVRPLRAYAYANFFLRFANLPFALNNFDVYAQHFTVMNYESDDHLYKMVCSDFIVEWDKQYPNYPWNTHIEPKILSVFRQVFEAAVEQPPPKGIAENSQSRALYAADLMLEWNGAEMQPKLLEINFSPDCDRACDYYPNFYNDVFKCLFMDLEDQELFHVIC